MILDYGMGNIQSILNAFKRLGVTCIASADPTVISKADGIILPGVGAFHSAMNNLHSLGFYDVLNEQVLHHKKPFLGICLGMQLIAEDSVESQFTKGLGWIAAHVTKIETHHKYPVPHVGWNEVNYNNNSLLFNGINEGGHFFFDHSYHVECDPNLVVAVCDYGKPIVAGIQKDNIFAVQFHPEKSQRNGAKLLRNFLNFVKVYR
ncbi:MAG: imidazole glycerol phosphate synthase subunit HisH [Gammaproteobacteria bacterium]|nr:imidazole glycerol phosphate synthase subunit HisH [Gammaproteobacteria bacterium]